MRTKRIVPIAVGALILLLQTSQPAPAAEESLSYTLSETWIEGGGGETKLEIQQEGNVAVARNEAGDVALVSDPAAGIVAAGIGSRFSGFSGLGFLVEMFEVLEDFGPGSELPLNEENSRRIESIEFKLERGATDQTLEGVEAQHHVLTIDLKVRQIRSGTDGVLDHATGRADLWVASDLPFSWLPYNAPNGYVWGLPLSFNYREVAAHVASELSDELMDLGLLLRAEIESTTRGDGGFEMTFVREVSVAGLKTSDKPLDRTILEKPVIGLTKATTILGTMMLAGSSCEQAAAAGTASLEASSDGAGGVSATGKAWLSPDTRNGVSSTVVLGTLSEAEIHCVAVVAEPSGLEAGSYPVLSPAAPQDEAGRRAAVVFLRGTQESVRLTILDSGTLTLAEADPGKLSAEIQGAGWTAALSPDNPTITDNVAFELSFTVDAPAPQQDVATATTSAAAERKPWIPVTFDPTATEPAAEWDFDGKGVKAGAIDLEGSLAAVAVRDELRVALIDLDNLSEVGSIEVEELAYGDPVSALAFSPAGDRLAIGMQMGTVKIVDTASRETLQQFQYSPTGSTFSPVKPLTFDDSGERLVGYSTGHIVVWDAGSGDVILSWKETGAIDDLEVTPDGTRVAGTVVSTSMKIMDLSTGGEICSLPGDFSRLAMHPSGDRLAVWSFNDGLVLASTDDCSVQASWPTEMRFAPELAWAADGEHVILGSSEGTLHLHSAGTGKKAGTWTGQGSASFVYAASGSSRVLSTAMGDGSKAMVWNAE